MRPRSVSFVIRTIGTSDAERLLGLLHRFVPQVAQHRLPERHRLQREDPVPAGVELVDDDVRPFVVAPRLVVAEPFDDVEVDVQPFARLDHVLGALAAPRRRRVQNHRTRAILVRRGRVLAKIEPRRNDVRVRHPTKRVVGSDDPRVGPARVRELLRRAPADVRAEEVEHRLPPSRLQDRPLQAARHECPAEVEVEDVGPRQQAQERRPLHGLTPPESARPVERPVSLWMELLALHDDEPRVDALPPQRLHVRPRDPRHVQRGVDYAEGSSHSTWSK